jgi:hypothetical protein
MPTSLSEIAGEETVRDRRLIMRAVDRWEAVRGGHAYPRMADFGIETMPDMAAQSFVIDVNMKNVHMSQLRFVGDMLQQDCSRDLIGKPVTGVPRGSLVSRLTDHYMQILANRAPMSFEAEYNDADGRVTKYRGIMLPLSDTGGDIDHILGVINCRSDRAQPRPPLPMGLADAVADNAPEPEGGRQTATVAEFPGRPPAPPFAGATVSVEAVCDMLEDLAECRAAAYMVRDAQERLKRREFALLTQAYALLHTARNAPLAFAGVLEECSQRLDDRDLVAVILKLVLDDDPVAEEMTLYATVLRRALREGCTPQSLPAYLEALDGGLAGLMREEPIPLNLDGLLRPR